MIFTHQIDDDKLVGSRLSSESGQQKVRHDGERRLGLLEWDFFGKKLSEIKAPRHDSSELECDQVLSSLPKLADRSFVLGALLPSLLFAVFLLLLGSIPP